MASSAKLPTFSRFVVYPESENGFINLLRLVREYEVPHFVIGGMSNLLVRNYIYDGVFIKTDKIAAKYLAEDKITLGTGVRMSGVIRDMASRGLGGLEGLAGIPGTVGGMVKQNAGAFGYEVSDRLQSALCYLPAENKLINFSGKELNFSYRNSMLCEKNAVLISATFELLSKPTEEIIYKIGELREQRLRNQPVEFPSLGSIFKRHNGVGAGFYIDRAGLKGFSIGGAQVSQKHAGFIVNTGGATADDYLRVVDHVKNRVCAVCGVELEEEIEII